MPCVNIVRLIIDFSFDHGFGNKPVSRIVKSPDKGCQCNKSNKDQYKITHEPSSKQHFYLNLEPVPKPIDSTLTRTILGQAHFKVAFPKLKFWESLPVNHNYYSFTGGDNQGD
jgi:hypothetical protein